MITSIEPSVINQIVSNGFCVGCGMCAGMAPDKLKMSIDDYGSYRPEIVCTDKNEKWGSSSLNVCPFADNGINEDIMAAELYAAQSNVNYLSGVGYHIATYVGHVNDELARSESTSGGLVTWLLKSLIETELVESVVCVGRASKKGRLFEYQIVDNLKQLENCRKSRYYPVELSSVIPTIRNMGKKVAVVGLPCFIKSLRLSSLVDPALRDCVTHTISLFCGHLKSQAFTSYLAKCCGVNDQEIISVDFRKSVTGRNAWDYDFEVKFRRLDVEISRSIRMLDVFGGNWSLGFFMLNACNFCDDIVGETADISVGDAWFEPYAKDHRGTNLLVCRHKKMQELIEKGIHQGLLIMQTTPPETILKSQSGAFRHRRDGLSYRLYLARKAGKVMPQKRVEISQKNLPFFNRLIQKIRLRIVLKSHQNYRKFVQAKGVEPFVDSMKTWVSVHDFLYRIYNLKFLLYRIFSKLPKPIRISFKKALNVLPLNER